MVYRDELWTLFENMKQAIAYDSGKTNNLVQKMGEVQGSIVGLFLIYCSEFSILSEKSRYILHADDSCTVCVADTPLSLTKTFSLNLNWCLKFVVLEDSN